MTEILSYSKINCFLYVTGKRNDGYHELYSLMACLELYDKISIEKTFHNKIEVFCEHPDVPEGKQNIAFKAATIFFENYFSNSNGEKIKNIGLIIRIKKNIPVGAGLGGGSSNAASVLMALNNLHGNIFSKPELIKMGLLLGADVPFFIFGSPAIVKGIGEKLEKCGPLIPYYLILCYPGVVASTSKVFKNFKIKLTENSRFDINTRLNVQQDIQDRAKTIDVAKFMHNDLETTAYSLYPDIARAKEEMEFVLSEKVCMTGSGSSLFAFFIDRKKAEQAYSRLEYKWRTSTKQVFLTCFKI